MLIQRLKQFAEHDPDVRRELTTVAYEAQPLRWLVLIDGAGRYQGLIDRMGPDRKVPRETIPKIGKRSGTTSIPNLAVDSAAYVVGPAETGDDGQPTKAMRNHLAFIALLRAAAAETEDEGLGAAAKFYDDAANLAALHDELATRLPVPADRYAFALADGPQLVCARPAAVNFWTRHTAARTAARSSGAPAGDRTAELHCSCCGLVQPLVNRHMTPIVGVPDGQQAGTSLISFNAAAFESYGWSAAYNSPTCSNCVEAYSRALNRLLRRDNIPRTRLDEGGSAILYWTVGNSALDLAAFFDQPDPELVRSLLTAPQRGDGRLPAADAAVFCTVVLGGASARIMVREWLDTTIEAARQHLAHWFTDLAMVTLWPQKRGEVVLRPAGVPALPPSLRTLLGSLVRDPRKTAEDAPRNLPAALIRAALSGGPLPAEVLTAAVHRMSATVRQTASEGDKLDAWHGPARMGLIRAALNRSPTRKGATPMSESLDHEQMSHGYLCGRLLAVLEHVQYAAVGDVGANIVDRFYGRAATSPRAAFPTLLQLARNHLRTLRNQEKRGLAIYLERQIQEVLDRLPPEPGFRSHLTLAEQGRFALGYYQQKADRFRRDIEATVASDPNIPAGASSR